MTAINLDLITMGRSSVDLYGEQIGGRLEDMRSFAKYVGGCPTNIAIGTSRLGLNSAIITRVGDEQMGRFIIETLAHEGVDVSQVTSDPDRLTALVILGIRDSENIPHIFYRSDCADMAIGPEHIDPAFVARANAVLVSGTHMSKPNVEDATRELIKCAKASGGKVIFDIDYRPTLWGVAQHAAGDSRFVASEEISLRLQSILADCDLIVGTEEEVHIAGGSTDILEALRVIRDLSPATIVLKRGALGCTVFAGAIPASIDDGISAEGFEVEVYNTLGAGDGFLSGFLRGWLRDEPLETCCRFGNACGAIVVSRHGCSPASPSWEELCDYLQNGSETPKLRLDKRLAHLHRATTRLKDWPEVCALAFDHRSQLEAIADRHGAEHGKIAQFKNLIANGAQRAVSDGTTPGALIDSKYGAAPLAMLSGGDWWLARPVEKPGVVPLEFECGENIALELRTWPAGHVAKCLVFYHPDDPEALRSAQEKRMLALYEACLETGTEMLLEIIPPANSQDDAPVARALERLYAIGLYPDWWKLPPNADPAAWNRISDVINRHDPHCRGIVILGQEASPEALKQGFDAVANITLCKGFAVGRSIFQGPADAWFAGTADDETTMAAIAENYRQIIDLWHSRHSPS